MIPTNMDEEQEDSLKEYRNYLLLSYNVLSKQQKNSITQSKMEEVIEIFERRFPERSFKEDLDCVLV